MKKIITLSVITILVFLVWFSVHRNSGYTPTTINHHEVTGQSFMILTWIVALLVGGLVYFLPAIVGRHKRNATAITVLNFCLGWTFIGWVIALVWATTKDQAA